MRLEAGRGQDISLMSLSPLAEGGPVSHSKRAAPGPFHFLVTGAAYRRSLLLGLISEVACDMCVALGSSGFLVVSA